ncbi:unnamed protein product [Echinostoma caproni]|uniref:Peptidase_M1 domain-containing protein n=1 Tax=Echinostoma caproni TaxID=27848 RepID=A0A183AVC4_9TREM|nr:unnamed protein product [Echinostoma caproni]
MQAELRRTQSKNVRLPYTVLPRFYNLRLQVHLNTGDPSDFFFNGSAKIRIQCMNATRELFIHAYSTLNVSVKQIALTQLFSNESESNPLGIRNISYNEDLQWYQIVLDEELQTDAYYILRFDAFRSALTKELKGWYLSSYFENGVKKYADVTLLRQKPYHSLSNMGLRESIPLENDWVADVFEPTVNTSTYLLAFVVSQFAHMTGKDSKGRNVSFIRAIASRPALDMIAVPDFAAGAMENWGLMIYREATMLWDPKTGTASSQQKVASVISHEIAHQCITPADISMVATVTIDMVTAPEQK